MDYKRPLAVNQISSGWSSLPSHARESASRRADSLRKTVRGRFPALAGAHRRRRHSPEVDTPIPTGVWCRRSPFRANALALRMELSTAAPANLLACSARPQSGLVKSRRKGPRAVAQGPKGSDWVHLSTNLHSQPGRDSARPGGIINYLIDGGGIWWQLQLYFYVVLE